MRWTSLAVLIMALIFAVGTARADDCASVELKAVGKKESGLLNCQSRVAATNDSSHLEGCRTKVEAKFSRALARDTCTGDETKCAAADDCDSAMATLLSDTFPSACEAAKRRAAGKLARSELYCYATAAAKGLAVDTACITKARDKFSAALTKAGTCPDGGAPRDAVEQRCVKRAVTTDCPGTVIEVCPSLLPLGLSEIPLCCQAFGICFGG